MAETIREYAEALFSLACEEESEKTVMASLEAVAAVFAETPEYLQLLSSPAIPLGERLSAAEAGLGTMLPERVLSFIMLLCEKGRITQLNACVREYRHLLEIKEATVTAQVTSAIELTEQEKKTLRESLARRYRCHITLETQVDPTILGGMIVEIGGRVMDGSLKNRLREVKEVMNR